MTILLHITLHPKTKVSLLFSFAFIFFLSFTIVCYLKNIHQYFTIVVHPMVNLQNLIPFIPLSFNLECFACFKILEDYLILIKYRHLFLTFLKMQIGITGRLNIVLN